MYHINNDPRCLKSCNLIYSALIKLFMRKGANINSITISELTSAAGVGRATFYRHFDHPIDVLAWAVDMEEEVAAKSTLLDADTYYEFSEHFFAYWTERHILLDVLITAGEATLLLKALERSMSKYSVFFFKNATSLSPSRREYLVNIWAATVWTILRSWVTGGKKETAAELSDIAVRSMPIPR